MSQQTLRNLRQSIIDALKTDAALEVHGVPFANIEAGSSNSDGSFPTPYLLVYAHPINAYPAESQGKMRIAEINIFCLVEPEIDAAESEMAAVELGEKVEKILSEHDGFQWITEELPTPDGIYANYAAAYVVFTHSYISSAL